MTESQKPQLVKKFAEDEEEKKEEIPQPKMQAPVVASTGAASLSMANV